jgi:uncharacterized surface protein with fasciclin (FAS1) repeats
VASQNSFLTNTLLYHSNGNLPSSQIVSGGTSVQLWVLIDVLLIEEMTYINGSKIILTNVNASNGTVHAIDKVMIATGVNIVESAILLKDSKFLNLQSLLS